MREELWTAYTAMIHAMDDAGYPYQAENYSLWRAFIGFGEGYLEYVHPDRYIWLDRDRPLYDRLKSTTEAYRSLCSQFKRAGLTTPTWGARIVREPAGLRMVPTRGRWSL